MLICRETAADPVPTPLRLVGTDPAVSQPKRGFPRKSQ